MGRGFPPPFLETFGLGYQKSYTDSTCRGRLDNAGFCLVSTICGGSVRCTVQKAGLWEVHAFIPPLLFSSRMRSLLYPQGPGSFVSTLDNLRSAMVPALIMQLACSHTLLDIFSLPPIYSKLVETARESTLSDKRPA